MNLTQTAKEAIIIAFIIVLIGLFVGPIVGFFNKELPDVCKTWNENHVMEISLFLTGLLAYFLFKLSNEKIYKFME